MNCARNTKSNPLGFKFHWVGAGIGLFAMLGLSGCASSRMLDQESDRLFREQQYEQAADHLKKGLEAQGEGSRDELLYLMDWGLSLHSAGKYEESTKVLLKADAMAEIKDYTSLVNEGATLLTSENLKPYAGEDFEKVLINTYLSMNFALQGDWEGALVEARRVNTKLRMMVTEGKRNYKQNAFARYLSASIYESEGNWNDAYVDYREVYKIEPHIPGLGVDLWRAAKLAGMSEDLEKWDREYGLSAEDHEKALIFKNNREWGEIIVLYENGISPVKRPRPNFASLPEFFPRSNPVSFANVVARPLGGVTLARYEAKTTVLHDIEKTAIENLDEKYAGMIAKKMAGMVAKEAMAHQLSKKTSPVVGELFRLIAYASDQADCRSWNLLPRDLQVARIPVPGGLYTVRLAPQGGPGDWGVHEKTVEVRAGKKVFVNFRFLL